MSINTYDQDYSVYMSTPTGQVIIAEGNHLELKDIQDITLMGHNEKTGNVFFTSQISYFHPKGDKTLELDYKSEFRIHDESIDLKDPTSDKLKSLLTELLFRHTTCINQFLYDKFQKDPDNFYFPPFVQSLKSANDFVVEKLKAQEEEDNQKDK